MTRTATISGADAVRAVEQVLARTRSKRVTVDESTRLEALGLTSSELVETLIAIEDATGCVVVTTRLPELVTVGDLARLDCL